MTQSTMRPLPLAVKGGTTCPACGGQCYTHSRHGLTPCPACDATGRVVQVRLPLPRPAPAPARPTLYVGGYADAPDGPLYVATAGDGLSVDADPDLPTLLRRLHADWPECRDDLVVWAAPADDEDGRWRAVLLLRPLSGRLVETVL